MLRTDAISLLALKNLVALRVATLVPAGFLIGFGFPTGMRLVSAIDERPTRWFWGINGAAGVLATGIAVATSIAFGIDKTLSLGGLCHLVAGAPFRAPGYFAVPSFF